MKFIYVMGPELKEWMEKRGYRLIKSNEKTGVSCFENKEGLTFDLGIPCVFSNVLTF